QAARGPGQGVRHGRGVRSRGVRRAPPGEARGRVRRGPRRPPHALAKGIHKHLGKAAPAAEAEPEPAADDEEHESPDALESKRDAIASLIKESGLPKDLYTKEMIAALAKKP